jgi:lipopolysaccharide-induced tumor necrosis factor-alpha factor
VRTTNYPAATANTMVAQARLPANNMMVPYQPGHLTKPTGTYSNLGRNPVGLQCPCCHRQTITVVQDRMGLETMVAIFLLALFFWPLCWLPLCMPSCKNTNHYCGHSECRRRIGETSACA